ncbi:putative nucleotide-binding protein [Magnetofaba australis IT-1]|uniref:Nucleotide-binding protein MAIT1_04267 n=1 Tax=Magnetofaba australis IT-1 TaxID=1434232 RepID=A0A1Y2K4P4_9PROT|nr:putative nucleotide-binding protein [Magnetofaba australis IT-1]
MVSEVDLQEVDNAVNQASKEIGTRYDFKGSKSELSRDDKVIKILADDDYKLEQVIDVLKTKLVKRKVDPGYLEYGKVEPASGAMVRQEITIKEGVETELAKKIVKAIKTAKLKVQAAIQGEQVRVTGKKRDDLQEAIALIKEQKFEQPLQYTNFRD